MIFLIKATAILLQANLQTGVLTFSIGYLAYRWRDGGAYVAYSGYHLVISS